MANNTNTNTTATAVANTNTPDVRRAPKGDYPAMPDGYGEPLFDAPTTQVKSKRGGGLMLTRVSIPLPSVGLMLPAAIWRTVEETGDATNVIDEISITSRYGVEVLEPIAGSRDNAITAALKNAVMLRWDAWYSAAEKVRPAVAGRLVRAK